MKNTLKTAALMLCVAIVMVSCNGNGTGKSNENKMAQFEKAATEFKATLDPSNQIIAERMDTVVQKVFYLEPNKDQEAYGDNPVKNILMHDYATNETLPILPEEEKISGYLSWGELSDDDEFMNSVYCFNLDYRNSELIGDRLFTMIHTECSFERETSLLFYVNVLDNSLHFVSECDDVKYDKANGTIDVQKELMKLAGADLEHDFTLSASLTDEEYAAKRSENAIIENQMIASWMEENDE